MNGSYKADISTNVSDILILQKCLRHIDLVVQEQRTAFANCTLQ